MCLKAIFTTISIYVVPCRRIRMGQDMSDSFGGIGEILEDVLVDDYNNMGDHDRAKTRILMGRFSGQRAPFRNFCL